MKKVFFQTHWLLGVTVGIVLMIIGITGSMLSFEPELLQAMNRDVTRVEPRGERLPLSELLARAKHAYPGRDVMSIAVDVQPDHSVAVTLVAMQAGVAKMSAPANRSQRRRGEVRFFNPYDGTLLSRDDLKGQSMLRTVERIHRGMVAGLVGRTVVGSCALLLFVMTLTGLYLRWPRRGKLQWRTWFSVNSELKGRAYLWGLHTVVATCVLPLLLVSTVTGSYQAFDWYRKGVMSMVGATLPAREAMKLNEPVQESSPDDRMNLDLLWNAFRREHADFKTATILLPSSETQAVEIRYLTDSSPHERAFNMIAMHPITGAVIKQEDFARKKTSDRFVAAILPLHMGTYFGLTGQVLMMCSALSMPFFAVTGWMMYLQRRRRIQLSSSSTPVQARSVG